MADLIDPTSTNYNSLTAAYNFFNTTLFQDRLPACLITLQRKNKANGYFAPVRFADRKGDNTTDEIALNPSHFAERTDEDILSTLVHEMTHLEQQHFGQPARSGYHNKAWAKLMLAVGLIPSSTGEPGGKQTGQNMTHYIEPGGAFARACAELLGPKGLALPYVDIWNESAAKTRAKKAASKTKYTCPDCAVNAWAKPGTKIICGECAVRMQAGGVDDDE